jgi:hypothetical protein
MSHTRTPLVRLFQPGESLVWGHVPVSMVRPTSRSLILVALIVARIRMSSPCSRRSSTSWTGGSVSDPPARCDEIPLQAADYEVVVLQSVLVSSVLSVVLVVSQSMQTLPPMLATMATAAGLERCVRSNVRF